MFKHIAFFSLVLSLILASCTAHKKAHKTDDNVTATIKSSLDSGTHNTNKPYNINEHYKPSYTVTHDIVHTALAVSFNWPKQWMYGNEALTMRARFYPSDTLTLDAKGITIEKVGIINGKDTIPLNYIYKDSLRIHVKLNRAYTAKESFTLCFKYIAKPEERKLGGSNAITSDKGLYFINPLNTDPNKPRQLWTQGETESNSVWMITVDKPDMKSTHEIAITIDSSFKTLSNGLLVSQKLNKDGTRTDMWKMDKPIAPYLFMMAAGNFAITHDKWHNIDVNYYTDPAYAGDAHAIFGHTPEMIEYYSQLLNYPYPWPKYSQVIAHDYVSGAMENTSATLHGEFVQQHRRDMIDGNQEEVICHELFHHWFGDLVTCESWSNITVNESFANYSEVLWMGHKYGLDEGDYINDRDMKDYLNYAAGHDADLVRFTYSDKEEVFDPISYQKGGRILNMLRHIVGDSAFFRSLNLYLKENAFKTGEAQQLRLAFEEVTGQDLNWFFNQWYYNKSYPRLKISYIYEDYKHRCGVIINQKPADDKVTTIWKLPMAVDVYINDLAIRYNITMIHPTDTFYFQAPSRPQLINVDAEKMLLCQKVDAKTDDQFVYQYYHAPLYKDRLEALDNALIVQSGHAPSRQMVIDALKDKYWRLRVKAISMLDLNRDEVKTAVKSTLMSMAEHDPRSNVRSASVIKLSKYNDPELMGFYNERLSDSSYLVEGVSLNAIYGLDKKAGYQKALTMQNIDGRYVITYLTPILIEEGDSSVSGFFIKQLNAGGQGQLYELLNVYGKYIGRMPLNTATTGINKLYDIARNNSTWWLRMGAMAALAQAKEGIKDQASTIKIAGADINKVNALNNLAADMETKMAAIKNAETDLNLKKYWK